MSQEFKIGDWVMVRRPMTQEGINQGPGWAPMMDKYNGKCGWVARMTVGYYEIRFPDSVEQASEAYRYSFDGRWMTLLAGPETFIRALEEFKTQAT